MDNPIRANAAWYGILWWCNIPEYTRLWCTGAKWLQEHIQHCKDGKGTGVYQPILRHCQGLVHLDLTPDINIFYSGLAVCLPPNLTSLSLGSVDGVWMKIMFHFHRQSLYTRAFLFTFPKTLTALSLAVDTIVELHCLPDSLETLSIRGVVDHQGLTGTEAHFPHLRDLQLKNTMPTAREIGYHPEQIPLAVHCPHLLLINVDTDYLSSIILQISLLPLLETLQVDGGIEGNYLNEITLHNTSLYDLLIGISGNHLKIILGAVIGFHPQGIENYPMNLQGLAMNDYYDPDDPDDPEEGNILENLPRTLTELHIECGSRHYQHYHLFTNLVSLSLMDHSKADDLKIDLRCAVNLASLQIDVQQRPGILYLPRSLTKLICNRVKMHSTPSRYSRVRDEILIAKDYNILTPSLVHYRAVKYLEHHSVNIIRMPYPSCRINNLEIRTEGGMKLSEVQGVTSAQLRNLVSPTSYLSCLTIGYSDRVAQVLCLLDKSFLRELTICPALTICRGSYDHPDVDMVVNILHKVCTFHHLQKFSIRLHKSASAPQGSDHNDDMLVLPESLRDLHVDVSYAFSGLVFPSMLEELRYYFLSSSPLNNSYTVLQLSQLRRSQLHTVVLQADFSVRQLWQILDNLPRCVRTITYYHIPPTFISGFDGGLVEDQAMTREILQEIRHTPAFLNFIDYRQPFLSVITLISGGR
jgi:hypothetical protein